MNQIDLGRALKAFFDDKEWTSKTMLGFVWILLGVTAPAAYGAQLEYIRRVSGGSETLPEWDDFGTKWVNGLLLAVAGFIYFLPIVILGGILFVPAIVAAIGSGDSGALGGLLVGGSCVFLLISIVYAIAMSLLFSAAVTNFAMKGTFGSLFEFGGIMEKVRGGTGYFTAWLYTVVISLIGSTVLSVVSATGIGAILYPAVSYFMLMATGHILGQWATRAYGVQPAAGYAPPPTAASYAPPAPPAAPFATPAPPADPFAPPAPPVDTQPPGPPVPPA